MVQVLEQDVLEQDAAAKAMTATINYIVDKINYIVDKDEKIFTVTAGPGGTDVRNGGAVDPPAGGDPRRPAAGAAFRA